jgi:hypothetical protein
MLPMMAFINDNAAACRDDVPRGGSFLMASLLLEEMMPVINSTQHLSQTFLKGFDEDDYF